MQAQSKSRKRYVKIQRKEDERKKERKLGLLMRWSWLLCEKSSVGGQGRGIVAVGVGCVCGFVWFISRES